MRTPARLHFTKARASTGHLTHKIREAVIYWYDGKPKYLYVTWACGTTVSRPPVWLPDDAPLTCRACAGTVVVDQAQAS